MGMYLLYEDISGASAPFVVIPCRWAPPSAIGFHPSSLGFTLRRWALASAVDINLGRWALASAVGLHLLSLGFTLHRWASPFVIGQVSLFVVGL